MSNAGLGGRTGLSLAEAKLARQNARIQQAEAALTAPLPVKRNDLGRGILPHPASRGFVMGATTQDRKAAAHGASEPEVRINTFRAPTRDPSLSRSMSSLSQRTTATHVSDSAPTDSSGFQVYTGRRGIKAPELLNAYEDKPEQKQITVEATVDTREIYEVFGNALPGTDYIQQNVGAKDGQLQFLQHPNGDVSAHQWSMERYVWENIGQFSNIRKKIEGLLAADRLRGESAHQTIQHNTLAYFRAIAKQREASSMGQHFDAANMLGSLPRAHTGHSAMQSTHDLGSAVLENSATVTGSQLSSQPSYDASSSSHQHYGMPRQNQYAGYPAYAMQAAYPGYPNMAYNHYGSDYGFGYPSWQPAAAQYNQRADRYSNNFFAGRGMAPSHDTAYAQESMHQVYGDAQSCPTNYPTRPAHIATESQNLNYDYHFPPVEAPSQPAQSQSTRKASFQQAIEQRLAATAASANPPRAQASVPPAELHPLPTRPSANPQPPPTFRWNADATAPPGVEPGNARVKMREHLARLSIQAKERSMSQGNIRTVLHDPFRTEEEEAPPQTAIRSTFDPNPVVELKKTVANPSGLPPHLFESARKESTSQRQQIAGTETASTDKSTNTQSSPESRWSRQETEATPQVSSGSVRLREPLPRPEGYIENTQKQLTQHLEAKAQAKEVAQPAHKSYERRVNDWWLNGSTFARHEELFNSIKAADATVADDALTNTAHSLLAPIGTPARKDSIQDPITISLQQKSDVHTRMLIPIWENLASYVQGPPEKRRDYFSQWTQAPEWAIDRNDNTTFFDNNWGEPPRRYGRDPRRQIHPDPSPGRNVADGGRQGVESVRFGGFSSPTAKVGDSLAVGAGLQGRFAFGRV